MAEGFARAYGSDVMEVQSAGMGPASVVSPQTIETMKAKNIDISEAIPKGIDGVDRTGLSLIVNITGSKLPVRTGVPVVDWDVKDPIGKDDKVFHEVGDDLERRVMELIMWLRAELAGDQRAAPRAAAPAPEPRGRFDTRRGRFR
jgi:protein-tyrosine-phosphatase